ncbi:MAG: DEAD/DEAH box helicase, partial [bacterium]
IPAIKIDSALVSAQMRKRLYWFAELQSNGKYSPILVMQPIDRNIVAKDISILVLDEADEMLSSGFKEQVYNIFQYLNNNVQVGLFSATLPPELQLLTDKFMRNPVRILVKSELLTLEGIKQYYVALNDDSQKYATLKDIFNIISMSQCIIYCNSIK